MSWLGKLMGGKASAVAAADRVDDLSAVRLLIDRHDHKLADLGVRTFRIQPYEGELIQTQHISFTMVLTVNNEEFKFPGSGVVREISAENGLVVQFQPPQPFFDRKLMEFLARRKVAAGRAGGTGRKK